MANIHSQKKRILRAERERLENRRYTSKVKTLFRRLEAAVGEGGDAADAEPAHSELVTTIDKAVKRGALHKNTGCAQEVTRRPHSREPLARPASRQASSSPVRVRKYATPAASSPGGRRIVLSARESRHCSGCDLGDGFECQRVLGEAAAAAAA